MLKIGGAVTSPGALAPVLHGSLTLRPGPTVQLVIDSRRAGDHSGRSCQTEQVPMADASHKSKHR